MPKAQEMQSTLRTQLLAELESQSWDVEEIGRQLGADGKPISIRQVYNHITRNGLPTFLTPDGRRRGDPQEIAAWLRQRLSERQRAVTRSRRPQTH